MISLRRIFAQTRQTPTATSTLPLVASPDGTPSDASAPSRDHRGPIAGRRSLAIVAAGIAVSTLAIGLFVASTSAIPGQEEAPSATPLALVAFVPDFDASGPEMDTGASVIQPSPTATRVSEVAAAATTRVRQEIAAVAPSPKPAQEAPAAALNDTPALLEAEVIAPAATPVVQEPAPQEVEAAPAVAPAMALPAGYTVEVSLVGCTSDGTCPFGQVPANFYWAPTRTAVLYPNQSLWTHQHEACHAHQHLTINLELGIEPAMPYDLNEWLATSEGATWNSLVTTAWPATGQWAVEPGAHNAIEDFGISCGLYLSDPQQLQRIDPIRYGAMVTLFG